MKARKVVLAALLMATAACPAAASDRKHHRDRFDSWLLTHFVTAERIHDHLRKLQRIADRNDDNRSLGTSGYSASVRYVADRLKRAHYKVTIQPFTANLFALQGQELEQVSPTPTTYVADTDFTAMTYSGSSPAGGVTAPLVAVDLQLPPGPTPSSTSGCEAADFVDVTGKIALIQRGTCFFEDKAQNAAAAGAVGVIIFNEGQPGRTELLTGTLGNPQPLPVVGATFALGNALNTALEGGVVTMRLEVNQTTTPVPTWNVLGEKKGRVKNQDVVVGAHLDSVPEGPGINDNGSGTAAILTIAEQISRLHIRPRNTLRFAFWGAEEEGLFGSNFYVDNLTQEQFDNISLNLNFDMVGSPNFARFVYDGDGTLDGEGGPPGSDVIEEVFTDYFDRHRLASEPTLFDGRSDYFAFINAGIPAGGLFSGAEVLKTPEQVTKYGGTAGVAFDPCYHEACDDIDNLSRRALSQFGKAAAHTVLHFAMTRQNVRPPAAPAAAAVAAAQKMDYRGSRLAR